MLDLLVKNASLPDGRCGIGVAVRGGRIVELREGLDESQAPAHEVLDAAGQLLSPPFVDAHFHMDATLSYGLPRVNASGTLLEGIALWGELKPLLTQDAHRRARAGLLRLGRGEGPAGDPQPRRRVRPAAARHRGAAAREANASKPYLDLQLVAFPQDGVLRSAWR